MTTHTTEDGTVALKVSDHPHAGTTRYWVAYTKSGTFAPVAVGDVIAKFASPGDAFAFAADVIARIDRARARYTERLEEIQP